MSVADGLRLGSRTSDIEAGVAPLEEERSRFAQLRTWRTGRHLYRGAALLVDAGVVLGFVLSAASILALPIGVVMAAAAAAAFVGSVAVAQGYDPRRIAAGVHEYTAILKGGAALATMFVLIGFFGLVPVPPVATLIVAAGIVMTTVLLRASLRTALGIFRGRGEMLARTLVVGGADAVGRTAEILGDPRQGHMLVGACAPTGPDRSTLAGLDVLGDVHQIPELVSRHEIDSLVVDPNALGVDEFRRLRWAMEGQDVEVLVTTELSELLPSSVSLRVVSAAPLLAVRTQPSRVQHLVKVAMDRTLAAVLLVIGSPILLGAMLAVRITSPGGAIFRQVRIGTRGRPFTMLKIRTMSVDAEQRKSSLENVDGAGPLFKVRQDPRITPIGRVLRRFSIDELPQLVNVLRGDMSLVGPRPPLASEVAVYDSMAVHRLNVRPGLTGLWQVSGRSDLSWDQAVRLDLLYVDNWSLFLDLKILWRTARAVLGARGAY